jgi:hypothetical protein
MGCNNIKENNHELLLWIERHDFVTIEQVANYKSITKQSACALLNRLVGESLLEKYRPLPSEACPYFFFITPKAKEVILEYYDDIEPGELILQRKNEVSRVSLQNIWHAKELNDYFLTLSVHSCQSDDYPGLFKWRNSRESHLYLTEANECIIPDGIGIFDDGNTEIPFCFEMDRETMPISRILDKHRKYLMFVTSDDLWDCFDMYPRIMFLTLRKDWAFKIKRQIEDYASKNGYWDALTDNHFLLSWTEDGNQKKDTLGENWIRAGWDDDFKMSFFD